MMHRIADTRTDVLSQTVGLLSAEKEALFGRHVINMYFFDVLLERSHFTQTPGFKLYFVSFI